MATQTIDLHGTTENIGNIPNKTLDVIGPGTLDVGNANPANITTNNAVIDVTGNFSNAIADFGTGVSTIELAGNIHGASFESLNAGDRIEIGKFTFDGGTYNTLTDMLTLTEGGSVVTILDLTLAPGAPHTFNFGSDAATGFDFFQVACFAAGTRILTLRGEVAVEDLREGDLVVTPSRKGLPLRPVKWIGWREVSIATHPRPDLVRPVVIRAHAFDEGLPRRDLVLSPDHALLVDGALMNVGKLVNGVSIIQDTAVSSVHYFHVELDEHDVLLAEGMPAESYLDTGNRNQFANAADVLVLHANFETKRMQTDACMPFVESGPALAAVRRRLIDRLESAGYRIDHDPELELLLNGRLVYPSAADDLCYRFELPEQPRELRVLSRSFTPAGSSAENEDCRRLGVCLTEIIVTAAGGLARQIEVGDGRLGRGFHQVESDGVCEWRWTDGDAHLPSSLFGPGGSELKLRLWPGSYWVGTSRNDTPYRIAV